MQYKIGGRIKENLWRNQNRYFISTFRYPKDKISRARFDFGYNVLPKVTIEYMNFKKNKFLSFTENSCTCFGQNGVTEKKKSLFKAFHLYIRFSYLFGIHLKRFQKFISKSIIFPI